MKKDKLFDQIDVFVTEHQLLKPDQTVLLGLSGGPDSIFLLHYLLYKKQQGQIKELIAAHLDHEWRAESENDVKFVSDTTKQVQVRLQVGKMSEIEYALKFDGSREAYGRHARRHFFQTVAKEVGADVIALGHHLQDQEETFFIRLIRGTSLSGLCAMWPKKGAYIRPLLQINKDDILTYLHEQNIQYLTDPTNLMPTFLRNRIRSEVLPALRSADARFDQNFLSTLNNLQQTELYLEKQAKEIAPHIMQKKDNRLLLDIHALRSCDPVLKDRLLMHWLIKSQAPFIPSTALLKELYRFFEQTKSKEHTLYNRWRIIKEGHFVYIEV